MKRILFAVPFILLASCGVSTHEDEQVQDTVLTTDTVVTDTTFDTTGIETVGELLDTLETIETTVE